MKMKKVFKILLCTILCAFGAILPTGCKKYTASDYYTTLKSEVLTDATEYKYITYTRTEVDKETKDEECYVVRYYAASSSESATLFAGVEVSEYSNTAATGASTYSMRTIVKPVFSTSENTISITDVYKYDEIITDKGTATDTYTKTEGTKEDYEETVSIIKKNLYNPYSASVKTVTSASQIDEENSKKNADGYTIVYTDLNGIKYTATLSRLTTFWTTDNGFIESMKALIKKDYVITKLVAVSDTTTTTFTWSIAYFTNESIKTPDASKIVTVQTEE